MKTTPIYKDTTQRNNIFRQIKPAFCFPCLLLYRRFGTIPKINKMNFYDDNKNPIK